MTLDTREKKRMKHAMIPGAIMAAAVFVLGFGMMFLLWNILDYPKELPGLFAYKAATFGDGICLPIMIFAVITYCTYSGVASTKQKQKCMLIALLSMLVGILIQVEWLISDDTLLNWTLPRQHHFNLAGWYHGVFFVMMFGLVGYMISWLWCDIHNRTKAYSYFERNILMLFVTAGGTFLLLHFADDYERHLPLYKLFSIATIVLLIMLIIYTRTNVPSHNKIMRFSCASGLLCGYGYALLICASKGGYVLLAVSGALCVIFLLNYRKYTISQFVFTMVYIALPCFGLFYVMMGLGGWKEFIWPMATVIVLTIMIEKSENEKYCFHNASIFTILLYVLLISSPLRNIKLFVEYISGDVVINLLFNIAVYLIFSKEIRSIFTIVTDAEVQKNNGEIDEKEFEQKKAKGYAYVIVAILIVLILVFHWIVDIVKDASGTIPTGKLNINVLALAVMCLCFIALSFIAVKKRKTNADKKAVLLVAVVTEILLVYQTLAYLNGKIMFLSWNVVQWIIFCFSVFACIGAAALSAHGFEMNLIDLRGLKKDRHIRGMSHVLFISNLILIFSAVAVIITNFSWITLLVVLCNLLLGFWALPMICAVILQIAYKDVKVVPNTALGGICQDCFSTILLCFFEICLPCICIGILNQQGVDVIFRILGVLINALIVEGFFLSSNVEHVQRQKQVLIKQPELQARWVVLRRCLIIQNMITIFAMLPYVLISVVLQIGKEGFLNSKPIGESMRSLVSRYIDKEIWAEKEINSK